MKFWQRLVRILVTLVTLAQGLCAMEFDFQPLSSLSRIEVNLATGFGSGTVRGTFGKMNGQMKFSPENPALSAGKVVLASRSLRFGYAKVAYDTHAPDWLDSARYPTITFEMKRLSNFKWYGRELRADADGILKIKGIERNVQIPMSIKYFRGERKKFEGKSGDLIRLDGVLTIPRSEFGISPGDYLDSIMEDIDVLVSLTGASNQIRPFLPSRLFTR